MREYVINYTSGTSRTVEFKSVHELQRFLLKEKDIIKNWGYKWKKREFLRNNT